MPKTTPINLLVIALSGTLSSGCTTEQLSRNVYDGIRTQNEMLRSAPPDYAASRALSYDAYERERRRLGN